jgi:hypothetical protein
VESVITDFEPVRKYDRWTLERTAESFEPPEVRLRRAQTRTRGRVARLLKSHGLEATRQQFLRDAEATSHALSKLATDIQRWAELGWLGDMRSTIERRTARNVHHMAELNAATQVLYPDQFQEADPLGTLAES